MWLAGIPVAGALSGTGVDVVVDANMPSNLGTGTDETEIIVGDFKNAYFFSRTPLVIEASRDAGWQTDSTVFRAHSIDFEDVRLRLAEGEGGYEVVHSSPGRELGVYVLVAPEPDRQQPTRTTRSTSSSKGAACWRSKGRRWNSRRAQAAFVPAVAEHRFIGYEQLGVLVIFAQPVRNA